MMSKWYLVKKKELYDRSWIVVDEFITQEPYKYKASKGLITYETKPIKVK